MEISRQKYWIGLPFPSPRDLPAPRIKPGSPASRADSLPSDPPGKPVYVNTKLLIYLSFSPLVTVSLLSMCVGLFLFLYLSYLYQVFLDSTYKQHHVFVFDLV